MTTAPSPATRELVPDWLEHLAALSWRVLAIAALGLVLVYLAGVLGTVTASILVALIVAATFAPYVVALRDRGWSRIKAAAAVFLGAFVVIGVTLLLIGLSFAPYVSQLIDYVQSGLTTLKDDLAAQSVPPEVISSLDSVATTVTDWLSSNVGAIASAVGSVATVVILGGFLTFFLLMDGDKAWVWASQFGAALAARADLGERPRGARPGRRLPARDGHPGLDRRRVGLHLPVAPRRPAGRPARGPRLLRRLHPLRRRIRHDVHLRARDPRVPGAAGGRPAPARDHRDEHRPGQPPRPDHLRQDRPHPPRDRPDGPAGGCRTLGDRRVVRGHPGGRPDHGRDGLADRGDRAGERGRVARAGLARSSRPVELAAACGARPAGRRPRRRRPAAGRRHPDRPGDRHRSDAEPARQTAQGPWVATNDGRAGRDGRRVPHRDGDPVPRPLAARRPGRRDRDERELGRRFGGRVGRFPRRVRRRPRRCGGLRAPEDRRRSRRRHLGARAVPRPCGAGLLLLPARRRARAGRRPPRG